MNLPAWSGSDWIELEPLHQNLHLEHVPYYPSGSVQKSGAPCKSPKSLAWEQGPALRIGTQLENLHLKLA
jgi:hypothetical protein